MRGRGMALLLLLAGMLSALVNRPASAGSDTDQLSVSVMVQSTCSLSGGTLQFGEYVSGQGEDLDAVGTITFINCNGDLAFELDGGGSGSVEGRQMRSGDSRINYQLYRNPNRTAVWGTDADAREVTLLAPQSGSLQVYGRIPKSQAVPDGLYTDVVNITLNF
jgi:spore coat protein U-like protein